MKSLAVSGFPYDSNITDGVKLFFYSNYDDIISTKPRLCMNELYGVYSDTNIYIRLKEDLRLVEKFFSKSRENVKVRPTKRKATGDTTYVTTQFDSNILKSYQYSMNQSHGSVAEAMSLVGGFSYLFNAKRPVMLIKILVGAELSKDEKDLFEEKKKAIPKGNPNLFKDPDVALLFVKCIYLCIQTGLVSENDGLLINDIVSNVIIQSDKYRLPFEIQVSLDHTQVAHALTNAFINAISVYVSFYRYVGTGARANIDFQLGKNEIFKRLMALDDDTTIFLKSKISRPPKSALANAGEIDTFVEVLLKVIEVVQYHKQSKKANPVQTHQ